MPLASLLVPVLLILQDSVTLQLRPYVRVAAPLVALTHVRVIDGTGASPRADQTILVRGGRIAAVGDAATTPVPAGAEVLDLRGRTVVPGLVMLHEHLFYPAGNAVYNWMGYSFPRLYLAGGVTTMRTGGSMVPYADLNLRRDIETGLTPGPDLDVTAPYLNGPGLRIPAVKALRGPDDARRMVEYWADEGATSFKVYMHISRAELAAVLEAAHRRGLKVTGHLCSVTFREAADLGIDNLEHGLYASTDFAAGKSPDQCPPPPVASRSLAGLDVGSEPVRSLIRHLVARGVAVTSTLPVFETTTPGRPRAPDRVLDAMVPEVRDQYLRRFGQIATDTSTEPQRRFANAMAFELAFARAGGLLVAGTDPTGYGGVVAGFANQRAIELLVEAGFTPVEAIRIATLNGARYLGRDREVGSVEPGKRADLIVVRGDPASRIADIAGVELVFKRGIGYDPERLIAAARGLVGLR